VIAARLQADAPVEGVILFDSYAELGEAKDG
jgi:hypothetical protein